MNQAQVSRRRFARIAGALAVSQNPLPAADGVSAQEVIKRIQSGLGGEWPAAGLDGLKAGNPETPIHGIATTAMATMSVLKQASKARLNMIVTHEPTFFGRSDLPS